MPNRFTVRFYRVERLNQNGLSFKQALELIDGVEQHTARERQLTAGLVVRLERCSEDVGEVAGEFTRVRTTDFPFEVRRDGVTPLRTDGPIGNGIAFRFRPADHTLAIQYDNRIVSPGRAMEYLMQFDGRAAFEITPKIDAENWRKFMQGSVRKLRIGIASPDHLGDVEDEAAAVGAAFRNLGDAYGAPVITIEMGMGNRAGELLDNAKGLATELFRKFRGGEADLRSLRAKVKTQDGVPAEEINLIDELISDTSEIDLPANDPERNYQVRRDFLKLRLGEHGNGD